MPKIRSHVCHASIILAAALLAAPIPASASSAVLIKTAIDNCNNQNVDPDTKIEACSNVIRANLATRHMAATFYFARATAYHAKGDDTLARADIDKAIEFKPDYPEAIAMRSRLQQSAPDGATPASPAPSSN